MFDELVERVVNDRIEKEKRKWELTHIPKMECEVLIASMKDEEPPYDFLNMVKKIRKLKTENKGLQRKITELQKELGRCE